MTTTPMMNATRQWVAAASGRDLVKIYGAGATGVRALDRVSVDLPEPDGPMMAVNSPRANSADTPASAWTWVSPDP